MKKFQLITRLAILLVAATLLASPSFALTVDLVAEEFTQNIDPDGTGPLPADPVTMWGFALSAGAASAPGPRIEVPPGDTTLTINLTNNLPEAISIVIPGQPSALSPVRDGSGRVTSLTNTVAGGGGMGAYTWTGLKPGTFIYHSGTNLAKQVHMGLYGAVTMDAVAGQAYPGVGYASEVILFYSEIDPALHASAGFAHPNDYNPRYFLVNGQPYVSGAAAIPAGSANQPTLVRLFNTALGDLVPAILGMPWQLVAEDGNPYPYPRSQHTTMLSAMKTKDAIITPTNSGTFTVFDRRGHLSSDGVMPGGMMVQLSVGGAGLTAGPDTATTAQDVPVDIAVLGNDPGATAVDSVTQPANGTATNNGINLTYAPNLGFAGQDAFTYRATDGTNLSNWATVTVTVTNVNDAPVATDDAYEVPEGQNLNVDPPGVLANDSDPDGDPLTASTSGTPPIGLSLIADGSFTYTPTGAAGSIETFQYVANDGFLDSTPATVTITVTAPPANQPPVAENDFASTTRNTPVTITVVANDSDPDGTIVPTSVVITSGSLSARGGTVANQLNGTVIYTPKRNFRGTDTFTYTVDDNDGETSNEATVQINVTR